MEPIQQASAPSASPSNLQPGLSHRMQHSKSLVAIVAVLGVTVMALAAALVVNKSNAEVDPYKSSPAAVSSPASKLTADSSKSSQPAPVKRTPAPAVVAQAPRANVCASCGTVEAVNAVQRQGEVNGVAVGNTTIGLGTVAGGVIGGLLGNQVGGGNGKTLATVAGVAGGAYAGNTIEKNMKKVTVYDVRVRMDDGTSRNMEISSAVSVGSKVIVEGKNLRMANSAG